MHFFQNTMKLMKFTKIKEVVILEESFLLLKGTLNFKKIPPE